ncbi:uncharacterized protein TNIN_425951 [Trichonephila inaurata madagascariensis]|uniref:Uncharacterized protein n=1 Tax=Trichonephila inaurata madagascariensis TaxID=2747483 RepID=A0A8X6YW94_9ARAC|nr:uncharacterized protein TNIN_425951 [Trichonephila inaurata madagascariensis]
MQDWFFLFQTEKFSGLPGSSPKCSLGSLEQLFFFTSSTVVTEKKFVATVTFVFQLDTSEARRIRKKRETSFDKRRQGEIIALIKPIVLDVTFWRQDHREIFTTKKESCLKFCFNEDGTVDRIKTAELLINSKRLSVRTRFVLACQYWSRWDVFIFFKKLPRATRYGILLEFKKGNRIFNEHEEEVVQWIKLYQKREFSEAMPWGYRFSLNWQCVSIQSRIVNYLSQEDKNFIFKAVFEDTNLMHVGRFCLSRMSTDHREQLLTRFPAKVLSIYLLWPYHNYFLDAANKVWDCLPEHHFICLLHIIICQKIVAIWEDFDYVDLLRQFWQESPDHFKQYAEDKPIFEVLMGIVKHGFPQKGVPRYFYLHDPYFECNSLFCFDVTIPDIWG